MDFNLTCLVIVKMASLERSESPPPANKRAKSMDFDSEIAPKVAKIQTELGLEICENSRNPSGNF